MIKLLKKRFISAGAGFLLLIVVLFLFETIMLNIAVALISVMITYELLVATKYSNNIPVSILALALSAFIPFIEEPYFNDYGRFIITLFVFMLFIIMLIYREKLRLEQVGLIFFIATAIPASMSTIVYLNRNHDYGMFLLLLTLGFAWVSDGGGFAFGMLFGKHKLAPSISPKKTIEGLIGSFVSNIIFATIMGVIFNNIMHEQFEISFIYLIILSIICTALSVLGDLSASIVKRQCSIKDFGSIMPGHGGMLDRFDSVLFVAPFVYFSLKFIDIIRII